MFDSVATAKDHVADAVMKAGLVDAEDIATLTSANGAALATMIEVSQWKRSLNSFQEALKSPQHKKWLGTQMAQYFNQCFHPSAKDETLEEMKNIGARLNSQMLTAQRLNDASSSHFNSQQPYRRNRNFNGQRYRRPDNYNRRTDRVEREERISDRDNGNDRRGRDYRDNRDSREGNRSNRRGGKY
ncbi:hypothetical protein BCR33DRAFT_739577 [Rhizoclosmatium globosum]|uniref:Uncharacterized protein n=1 Tax=Rhizoclosmatium globosum TaxID=329046 RepID=A0A1Y2C3C5_9FUNG|nr:hypothetical protein HDU99_005930 [Rhizoclosmatium hyalinum]ORY41542.1 hypothetical protein BCR33DRAFT_739577 [Rhizoclosmatium globosum]|eukprot:ORY41542.1 hypothetical protein BCR33DRAFT_739577 [Rhizoclosmatium globosum]